MTTTTHIYIDDILYLAEPSTEDSRLVIQITGSEKFEVVINSDQSINLTSPTVEMTLREIIPNAIIQTKITQKEYEILTF